MGARKNILGYAFTLIVTLGLAYTLLSCGGGKGGTMSDSSGGGNAQTLDAAIQAICNCSPDEQASTDYRHNEKHVGLPGNTGQTTTVAEILTWAQGPDPAFDAPRTGRELQEFLIPQAWLQFAWVFPGDCDIHFEISDVPDKTAPRMIVETPVDSEYCSARQTIVEQLGAHGFILNTNSGEINPPLQAQVLGLAFQDSRHPRGTQYVATVWELHPAIVTLTQ